jgi:hypothetical protein
MRCPARDLIGVLLDWIGQWRLLFVGKTHCVYKRQQGGFRVAERQGNHLRIRCSEIVKMH